jgi:hypothetical protein
MRSRAAQAAIRGEGWPLSWWFFDMERLWAVSRTGRGRCDFFLAVVAASMILKGLSVKTVGHLSHFMAASNKTNGLWTNFLRLAKLHLAVSMILNMLVTQLGHLQNDDLAASVALREVVGGNSGEKRLWPTNNFGEHKNAMIILIALRAFMIPLQLRRPSDDCLRGNMIIFEDHLRTG